MLVRALMMDKENLTMLKPIESIGRAIEIMEENNFLSLPVVEDDKFLGSLSREKVYSEFYKECCDKKSFMERKVTEFLRDDIPVIMAYDEIEEASYTLQRFKTPFVAVVNDKNQFEGIVTHYAIFKAFAEILGINRGKRIAVIAYDIPGQIKKLADIVNRFGGDIISFAVIDPKVKTDVREVVMRIRAEEYARIIEEIKEAGFRVQ